MSSKHHDPDLYAIFTSSLFFTDSNAFLELHCCALQTFPKKIFLHRVVKRTPLFESQVLAVDGSQNLKLGHGGAITSYLVIVAIETSCITFSLKFSLLMYLKTTVFATFYFEIGVTWSISRI